MTKRDKEAIAHRKIKNAKFYESKYKPITEKQRDPLKRMHKYQCV